MILPRPTTYSAKSRIAVAFGDRPEQRTLSSTSYTLEELNAAFLCTILGNNDENDDEFGAGVIGFWSLPSGPNGVLELLCFPVSSIRFWAISQVSDLVLVDKMPPPAKN